MTELALPLLALGSLYIYSNKKDNNKKEGFLNQGLVHHDNTDLSKLPNTNIPNPNFPINSNTDVKNKNYVRQYSNPNQTTDKFFDRQKNLLRSSENSQKDNFESMNGNTMNTENFKHNNMVPFFGGRITGPSIHSNSETILDNRTGSGSQSIKRTEQAPLFTPSENSQNVFGTPNNSDFLQSRVMPSSKIANVLPWEQKKVAPGLGLGYTTEGQGGYNSGMMERGSWKPPTVDELRVKTNPKQSFTLDGHQGPAESKVNNRGMFGAMERNRPDRHFELGSDRWFTTTNGLGQTQRAEINLNDNNRSNTTEEYFGVRASSTENKQNYYRGTYEPCTKPELAGNEFNPANAIGQGNGQDLENRTDSFNILKNNRNANCQPDNIGVGGANGTLRAIIAPIVDIFRPTRKENIINNAKHMGNVKSVIPNLPISNPNDRLKTTIKETTSDRIGLNHLNVSHIPGATNGYDNYSVEIKDQQRNMGDSSNFGNIQGQNNEMNRLAWNNQLNNVNKTYQNRPNPGGTEIFNGSQNINIARNENDRVNIRAPVPNKKMARPESMYENIPSVNMFGKVNPVNQLSNDMNAERMNPDILSAFKSNPYAQPLNVY